MSSYRYAAMLTLSSRRIGISYILAQPLGSRGRIRSEWELKRSTGAVTRQVRNTNYGIIITNPVVDCSAERLEVYILDGHKTNTNRTQRSDTRLQYPHFLFNKCQPPGEPRSMVSRSSAYYYLASICTLY
jgi:hypothetical protein